MTDKEIIKALECCTKPYCNNNECPLHQNTVNTKDCITQLSTNALDLINRQQAEIERLKKGWKVDVIETENIKAETIKEFAEKVKMAFYYEFDELIPSIMADKIDNLVKEMVGEQE